MIFHSAKDLAPGCWYQFKVPEILLKALPLHRPLLTP